MTIFIDNVTPISATWLNQVDNKLLELVSVKDFKAAGDGVTDDTLAIQSAIDSLKNSGGVIRFPRGHYKVLSALTLYSNIYLVGDGVDVSTLDYSSQTSGNWLNIAGSVGAETPISIALNQSDTSLSTITATIAAVEDDWLLTSQRNALSADAGDWQLGVGTGSIVASYFSEVLTVTSITNSTTFTFNPPLLFPGYRPDNTLETDSNARPAATVRKVTWMKNVKVSGLTFIAGTGTNAINFQWAKHCSVEDCKFVMGAQIGTPIQFTQSYLCKSIRCRAVHLAAAGTITNNFSFTTFKAISSWNCGFVECESTNGSQCFDVSYNGYANPSVGSYMVGCRSINAQYNAATTHSGSYGTQIVNNQFIGCKGGISIRSRASIATGNIITGPGRTGSNYGIFSSDGWSQDSIISENVVENFADGLRYGDYSSVGRGLINGRVLFANNVVKGCYRGIYLSHDSTWLTSAYCNVTVRGNKIVSPDTYGIYLSSYLNGVVIDGNEVIGPFLSNTATSYALYHADNSVDCVWSANRMVDIGANVNAMRFTAITDTTTFPAVTWPHAGTESRYNRVLGAATGGTTLRETTLIKDRVRSWTSDSKTVAGWENSGGAVLSVTTDNASVGGIYIGNATSQKQAGLEYNNASNLMTIRTSGGYQIAMSSAYFRPYADNVLTCGNVSNRWANMYSRNVTLSPPAAVTSPTNNGEMTFEFTNDTTIKIKAKGSDGIVRSTSLTLA